MSGESGSVTLEAALVVPWIMLLTFLLILFALYVMNRTIHYYTVSSATFRIAHAWPHSSANLKTGGYPEGGYDGLYWRLKDDAMLAGLFGWGTNADMETTVSFGEKAPGGQADSLVGIKLRHAAASMPAGLEGTVAYRNRLWLREVSVEAAGSDSPDPLRRLWPSFERGISSSASAVVNEPAEWVRTFQLVRYYLVRMQQNDGYAKRVQRQASALPGGGG
jgi:hypothetical protein